MTTPETTSFQVRAELEDLLERDLLGPWDGSQEELPPGTSPAERYMSGDSYRGSTRKSLPTTSS